jgi:hypothetical protein
MIWLVYSAVILLISGIVGLHLGRFREAYTEMTGMMAGMTMGMLNGFVLGYAAGAYFTSMFWANLTGILLGLALGIYFGRAGGLMGIMDGGMGGVMGGSMGAMLALMIIYPTYGLIWTTVLLTVIYLVGMASLVVLIERSAPGHRALHKLAPFFTRAVAAEIEEANIQASSAYFDDYYTFLGVERTAGMQEINDAYLDVLSLADDYTIARAERAISILSDPARRRAYDARLDTAPYCDDCLPAATAPRKKVAR